MQTVSGQPISSIIVFLNKIAKLRVAIIFDKLTNDVGLAASDCLFRSHEYFGLRSFNVDLE
jgi:hypothetical protein